MKKPTQLSVPRDHWAFSVHPPIDSSFLSFLILIEILILKHSVL